MGDEQAAQALAVSPRGRAARDVPGRRGCGAAWRARRQTAGRPRGGRPSGPARPPERAVAQLLPTGCRVLRYARRAGERERCGGACRSVSSGVAGAPGVVCAVHSRSRRKSASACCDASRIRTLVSQCYSSCKQINNNASNEARFRGWLDRGKVKHKAKKCAGGLAPQHPSRTPSPIPSATPREGGRGFRPSPCHPLPAGVSSTHSHFLLKPPFRLICELETTLSTPGVPQPAAKPAPPASCLSRSSDRWA